MIIDRQAQIELLDFNKGGGLVPLIAQHAHTGEILMLGYADREALARTLAGGEVCFFSRSRGRLWRKGESSGHTLALVSLHADCDGDAVVALVVPAGPTCHSGARSCFEAHPTLVALAAVLEDRAAAFANSAGNTEGPDRRPAEAAPGSYTRRLLADRNLRLKKLAEEAAELALACTEADPSAVAAEAADLLYHALVACRAAGVDVDDILAVLAGRRRAGRSL
ncbi:MAG: bifunctional phosphoribosyl-AMP cyclohydrolase/phosphoribosyl-ATP diphosphatase HisIE [Acidobacteriota bacterium]